MRSVDAGNNVDGWHSTGIQYVQHQTVTCTQTPTHLPQRPLQLLPAAPWQQRTRARCLHSAPVQNATRCKGPDTVSMTRVTCGRRRHACTATMSPSTMSCIGKWKKSNTAVKAVKTAHRHATSRPGAATCAKRVGGVEGDARTRLLLMRMRRRRR
jgi:hypothetical protein